MDPKIRSILEANGCDTALIEVPTHFETTENPLDPNLLSSDFQTQKLYDISACQAGDNKTASDKYWHIRRYYLNQVRATTRNQLIEEEKAKINEILKSGDNTKLQELFKKRHEWRKAIHNFRSDDQPICDVENCHHVALKGSTFCINHITHDKSQKLYVECEKCHQPHPVFAACLCCNDK
ncbi:hypothetical protein TRFO_02464 [Tritrichomonas foetus]|uniref:Potential DNA-binding domain-containing protein n=1 Tax=Tritrichomonas foetus TaxID=1144522 RepID=A0A1J4L1Q8_9EUKA|nr:hypothetical protein TRFO_02464 [Tritrichomonas foetus]|eukprot:OHT17455.1 hypothetical protein TRFO_02464 [Tritrichomonas foetus]